MKFTGEIKINGRVRVCLELVKGLKLKDKVLVDIGSSFGWLEKEISSEGLRKIVGIEPNNKALSFARKSIPNVDFRIGNALETGLPDSLSDIVVLFDVIEHLPKLSEAKALDEIRRILKKGGVLLLSTPYNHFLNNILDPAWYFGHRHYSLGKITELLGGSGFKIDKIEIKGKLFAPIYMLWFYINKWIFANHFKNFAWLDKKYDDSYQSKGLHTIFVKAIKAN